MGKVNIFDYLPQSIKRVDTSGDLKLVTNAINSMLGELSTDILKPSWDVENADREELDTIAYSLGLFPENYFTDDILKLYIRSAGDINELKGTDELITHLVDNLTHFKVYDIFADSEIERTLRIKVLRQPLINFDVEEKVLDHLIEKYRKLSLNYAVTYVLFYKTVWNVQDTQSIFKHIIRSKTEMINFEPVPYLFDTPYNLEVIDSDSPVYPKLLDFTVNSVISDVHDFTSSGSIDNLSNLKTAREAKIEPIYTTLKVERELIDIDMWVQPNTTQKLTKGTDDLYLEGEIPVIHYYTPFELPQLY